MRSKWLDEAEKEVPRACPNLNVIVVRQADKILKDARDERGVVLEELAVADAYLHVLELDSGMRIVGDACLQSVDTPRLDWLATLTGLYHFGHHLDQSLRRHRRWFPLRVQASVSDCKLAEEVHLVQCQVEFPPVEL